MATRQRAIRETSLLMNHDWQKREKDNKAALTCLRSVLWREGGTQLPDAIHYPALPHVGFLHLFLHAPLSLPLIL